MSHESTSQPRTPSTEPVTAVPLVVDLDGTLLRTDVMMEAAVRLGVTRPWALFAVTGALFRGGAARFKRALHERVAIDPAALPYREPVLAYLREAKRAGRRVILATAADETIARTVADHVGLFDAVIASDGQTNRKGRTKLEAIRARLGQEVSEGGFEYMGDGAADLAIWEASGRALMVNPSQRLRARAEAVTASQVVFEDPGRGATALLRAMRPTQWAKNVLLAVPMLVGHAMTWPNVAMLLMAMVCFSLAASAVYLMNDLMDLPADRAHPSKCRRPIASGLLSIQAAIVAAAVLLVVSVVTGLAAVGVGFGAIVFGYIVASSAYSLLIKRIVLFDVVWLACLYTLRIVAGGAAVSIFPSPWLLAFSLFFFLGLAFAKRYTELVRMEALDRDKASGRGYVVDDMALLRVMGPVCACMSVLVMGLYITSEAVTALYATPEYLWFIVPLQLYWVARIWLITMRGRLDDDPVVYTLRDPVSYAVGALGLVFIALAAWGPGIG